MKLKGAISNVLRGLGLTQLVDRFRFLAIQRKNRATNEAFLAKHPDIRLPPDYLMYESFRLDYSRYYYGGQETAKWMAGLMMKHSEMPGDGFTVLDWGCGPGRVVRHLQDYIPVKAKLYGTDYNAQTIAWCSAALPGISFNNNALVADLPYTDASFDAAYGISIFTHLSEAMHWAWIKELRRVIKPGGLLILTLQGDNFRAKLSLAEREQYDAGGLVVRGKVTEGHRTYSAFHPDAFLGKLFAGFDVQEKIVTPQTTPDYTPQDTWVLRVGSANL